MRKRRIDRESLDYEKILLDRGLNLYTTHELAITIYIVIHSLRLDRKNRVSSEERA